MNKKNVVAITMVLALVSVQDVAAQSFWKTLGKVAEKVLTTDTSNSSTNSSSSSLSGSSSNNSLGNKTGIGASFTVYGVDLKVTGCEHWGDDVVVRLLLTNNTSSDVKFGIGSTGPHMESYRVAYSPDGKNHEIEGYINGENADFVKSLPVGIPVKGYVLVKGYDKKYTSIQSLKFTCNDEHGQGSSDINKSLRLEVRNLPVTFAQNTNLSNIYCSLPTLYVQYNNCTRIGNTVTVNMAFKNLSSSAKGLDIEYGNHIAYDAEGNSYTPEVKLAARTLQPEIPVKATFTIQNVPANVTGFSYIKIPFEDKYYIEMRNINFK